MSEPTADVDLKIIDNIVAELGSEREQAIAILGRIQDHFHYLPPLALKRVQTLTGIPPAQLEGVATFYSRFRLLPAGKHAIKVCTGTACHVKGAEDIYAAFRDYLQIPPGGDTDPAGLFSLSKVACLGCCMLAPAVMIDELIYGYMTKEDIPATLRDFLQKTTAPGGPGPADTSTLSGTAGWIKTCTCSSCRAAGALAVCTKLRQEIRRRRLTIPVYEVGCSGISYQAPLVSLSPAPGEEVHYGRVTEQQVRSLLHRHFPPTGLWGRLTASLADFMEKLYRGAFELIPEKPVDPVKPNGPAAPGKITTYQLDAADRLDSLNWGNQQHIVTARGGELVPLDLAAYRSEGGMQGLQNVLNLADPWQVLGILRASGLRGRGGAGYLTAAKWETLLQNPAETKYLVCNGDEGDPGAFMDRMLMESFPFRIIEGILICAATLQIRRGFLYIRSEYPLAVTRMQAALEICREAGLLGSAASVHGVDCELTISEGAGAFVCGEETALLAALQGERGEPSFKPPYPSERGYHGLPTLVNNVETFATLPWIMREGSASFTAFGTPASRGTKTFALAGKVKQGGLIEVPMGITLEEIVYRIGGGILGDKQLKAIQIGGPSGGCIPAALAATPVDFDALQQGGAIMGSGGMVVLDEEDCMVEIARYFMAFTQSESCGKCTYCRIGTRRMLEILERLTTGKARAGELRQLEELAETVRERSVCGLGKTAPNPVISTLQHFRSEYLAHLEGRCPAGHCRALISYSIAEECIGCTLCARHCPAAAIRGETFGRQSIDPALCIRCGTCRRICPQGAVTVK